MKFPRDAKRPGATRGDAAKPIANFDHRLVCLAVNRGTATLLVLTTLATSAIGPSRRSIAADTSVRVQFVNQSQYELRELRVHDAPIYLAAPNLLEVPLAISGTLVTTSSGPRYITFFREKYRGGPLLAFTTAAPIELEHGMRYRITIYDESFRVEHEPDPSTGTDDAAGCGA